MSDEATEGTAAESALRTLAGKMNWLIDRARPAGRGPYTNAELAALIERATGEQVSHATVWKLRNGQAANPQMKLIAALARTFGVHSAFFFDSSDEHQAGLLHEQAELLALVRDVRVSSTQLRMILELSPEVRQAIIDLIVALTEQGQAPRRGAGGEALTSRAGTDRRSVVIIGARPASQARNRARPDRRPEGDRVAPVPFLDSAPAVVHPYTARRVSYLTTLERTATTQRTARAAPSMSRLSPDGNRHY